MSRLAVVLAGCILLLSLSPMASAQLVPVGPPFRLHHYIWDLAPWDVAVQPDGSYLVVWAEQEPSVFHLHTQAFDRNGLPLGPEQELSDHSFSAQAAALPDGRFVVVWERFFVYVPNQLAGLLLDRNGVPQGQPFVIDDVGGEKVIERAPVVAAAEDSSFAVVWAFNVQSDAPDGTVVHEQQFRFRRFHPDGAPQGPSMPLAPLRQWSRADSSSGSVSLLPGGRGWCTAWLEVPAEEDQGVAVFARRLDAQGLLSGAPQLIAQVAPQGNRSLFRPEAFAQTDGSCLVLWRSLNLSNPDDSRLFIRRLRIDEGLDAAKEVPRVGADVYGSAARDRDGNFVLAQTDFASLDLLRILDPQAQASLAPRTEIPLPLYASAPVLGVGRGGEVVLAWTAGPTDTGYKNFDLFVQRFQWRRLGGERELFLGENGRFRLTATWKDRRCTRGEGNAVLLSPDSGGFWFFSPDNAELLVKVLDARSVNGSFWVLLGGLSDLETTLTVTDTATGAVRIYTNPAGKLPSRIDTGAFPAAAPAQGVTVPASFAAAPEPAAQGSSSPVSTICELSDTALCLQYRFRLEVQWRDFAGRTGSAHTRYAAGRDSGYFWFFGPDNLELAVKMLDGTAVNGHFWLYVGALTNVEYTLTVTDVFTGAKKTYSNRLGQLRSFADTAAF